MINKLYNSRMWASFGGALRATPNKTTKKTAKILQFIVIVIDLVYSIENNEQNENISPGYLSIYMIKARNHVRMFVCTCTRHSFSTK